MNRTIEIDAEFFEHLLNCMANQKYIGSQLPEKAAEKQKIIDEAWRKGMDILNPIVKTKDKAEDALKKFNKKLHKDLPLITKKIKDVMDDNKYPKDYVTEYAMKWTSVRQDCEMYCLIAESVDKEEFEKLCEDRSYTRNMRDYIIEVLKHVGLGDNLELGHE